MTTTHRHIYIAQKRSKFNTHQVCFTLKPYNAEQYMGYKRLKHSLSMGFVGLLSNGQTTQAALVIGWGCKLKSKYSKEDLFQWYES